MKESFEISVHSCDLTEVRDDGRVQYAMNDGDTILIVGTNDPAITETLTVSKFNNARVTVVITVDHDDMEYKGVEP